jgi:Protein of unknown function (DUF1602).
MISSGSMAMERASATRRAMPPESCSGISPRAPRRPTECSFMSTMSWISSLGRSVRSRIGKAMFSKVEMSVNSPALLEHHAHLAAHLVERVGVQFVDDLALDLDVAGRRPQLAADQPEQRGLAAAAGAEDGHHLAARHVEVEAFQTSRLL